MKIEILKRIKIREEEKILIEVLINICEYYKIYETDKIIKYIKNTINIQAKFRRNIFDFLIFSMYFYVFNIKVIKA